MPMLAMAKTPQKGEMTLDAGIGVGIVDYNDAKATFTQRVGAEWVVAPELFNNSRLNLALGFYINNAYGGKLDWTVVGQYNYTYQTSRQTINSHNRPQTSYISHKRSGVGVGATTQSREDLSMLPTISFRYEITDRLEGYLSIGAGVGIMHTIIGGDVKPVFGLSSSEYYNDMDHVVWEDNSVTKVTAALATYIGARYRVGDNWGLNAQFGLVSGNLKKSMAHSFNLFSVGASWYL